MQRGVSGADTLKKELLIETGLLICSAALFSLSFPNVLSWNGIPFLAWVCLAPALIVINTCPWSRLFLYGPLLGVLSCGLFNYWLGAYHPLGLVIACTLHALWYLILVLVLRLVRSLYPQHGLWVQALLWLSYEYARIQGFFGYPYGSLAYTQFGTSWLVGSASLWGIWGVSLLVAMPSVWLGWHFRYSVNTITISKRKIFSFVKSPALLLFPFVWAGLAVCGLVWVLRPLAPEGRVEKKGMILVQQNMDPWIGGYSAYEESLERLIRQSRSGLVAHPEADMVVWAETSFIPSIAWHDRFRKDQQKYALVRRVQDFSREIGRPLVLGNDDAVPFDRGDGTYGRRDYNAVLVMQAGEITGRYHKNRLVPFTESFPFEKELPWVHKILQESGTGFWDQGQDRNLLEADGVAFGAPICFEDSFAYISADFCRQGAELLVNLSNDSWSKSVPGAMQHLGMAVFRSAENNISMVRSTNGGMSALILPDGTIGAMNEPFTESWLYVEAPIMRDNPETPARRIGDTPGAVAGILSAFFLLAGLSRFLFGFEKLRRK